ncbi:TlpA disulfide reductase family protein [uncultured Neptuniibacter sp.]|uniref:TlpA family protein disulfide reductase n=1 Tax=uncultured Neptuniibacter sp. TaxID=502143 RepID=UPI0026241835|nr:TlpA disulfide reductase family protein [uncultured Neptuniibacter sp.]
MKSFLSIFLLLSLCFSSYASETDKVSIYELSFNNVDQQSISLADFEGKVILVNFWATWCPPCVKEMPSMQRLRSHFDSHPFEIIAINAGEDPTTISSFLLELETELTFPILLDEQNRSFNEFGIRGLPMSILFDQNGKLVETILGGREWDSPEAISKIEKLLEKKQPAA